MLFQNRQDAGKKLALELAKYKEVKNLIVLGIPRGGVVVAKEVSDFLNASLNIVVVRKIGHPYNEELAVAAVDEDAIISKENGTEFISETYLEGEAAKQKDEIKRRLKEYTGEESHPDFKDKVCIIVDDGIATGLTTLSAIDFIKNRGADKIILAVPVIPADKVEFFKQLTNELIYLDAPELFFAVGEFYEDFPQTSDEEVKKLLKT